MDLPHLNSEWTEVVNNEEIETDRGHEGCDNNDPIGFEGGASAEGYGEIDEVDEGVDDVEHEEEDEEGIQNGDGISNRVSEVGCEGNCVDNAIPINGMVDILNIDMKNIVVDDVSRYDFGDLAYEFYCWYSRMNGFAVRNRKENFV